MWKNNYKPSIARAIRAKGTQKPGVTISTSGGVTRILVSDSYSTVSHPLSQKEIRFLVKALANLMN